MSITWRFQNDSTEKLLRKKYSHQALMTHFVCCKKSEANMLFGETVVTCWRFSGLLRSDSALSAVSEALDRLTAPVRHLWSASGGRCRDKWVIISSENRISPHFSTCHLYKAIILRPHYNDLLLKEARSSATYTYDFVRAVWPTTRACRHLSTFLFKVTRVGFWCL